MLEAFVDLGREVALIRESSFVALGLRHDHVPLTMMGFGNNLVHSLGSAELDLTIDDVAATVVCRVVNDNLLGKPMLIGQTFSE